MTTELEARSRAWSIMVALVLIIVGLFWTTQVPAFDLGAFAGSSEAQDFTVETLRHGTFTLSEHRGEIVVLDLMAVDCASCRITEKAVLRLAEARPDVTILSVDIWTHLEDPAYLDNHMQRLGADWPYAMDTDDLLFKYAAYEISKVVIIDEHGAIAWTAVGGISFEPLLEAVDATAAGTAVGAGALQLGLVGFAALAGVFSFFAPCAFPLLPGYIAYSVSRSPGTKRGPFARAVVPGLAAAAGIVLVFAFFGVLVAALGEAGKAWLPYLQPFVGVLAILLGLALLLGAKMDRLVSPLQRGVERARHRVVGDAEGTLAGYFSYGVGYGAAAAGCVAPVFLQLTFVALSFGALTGLKIFLVYAGVAGILMVLATVIAVTARGALQRRAAALVQIVNPASGVVLVLAGIYLIWFFQRGFGPL